MGAGDRIGNEVLVEAGLEAMRQCGKPLSRLPSKGRAMIYTLPNGETVRMRTCNDHVLIVVGDRPEPDAKLNIEGTDWLLVVMPEVERRQGRIVAYLLPTAEVEAEARRTHKDWLASNPNTKGDGRAWPLWFGSDAPGKANDYGNKWAKYRLDTTVDTTIGVHSSTEAGVVGQQGNIKAAVENARRQIAEIAGVPAEAVKIIINFEG